MRGSAGEVAGTVIMAKEALQVGTEASTDRVGLLDRIGQRLTKSLELNDTLRQVAETLVPQFADHCFIDLRKTDKHKGEVLIRRVQMNAWDWEPPQGHLDSRSASRSAIRRGTSAVRRSIRTRSC